MVTKQDTNLDMDMLACLDYDKKLKSSCVFHVHVYVSFSQSKWSIAKQTNTEHKDPVLLATSVAIGNTIQIITYRGGSCLCHPNFQVLQTVLRTVHPCPPKSHRDPGPSVISKEPFNSSVMIWAAQHWSWLKWFQHWCVLRREWMGCWGLLGWLLIGSQYHSQKFPAFSTTIYKFNLMLIWRFREIGVPPVIIHL